MSANDNKNERAAAGSVARRPYVAPRIEESGRFEHLVLGCSFQLGEDVCDPDPGNPRTVGRTPMSM